MTSSSSTFSTADAKSNSNSSSADASSSSNGNTAQQSSSTDTNENKENEEISRFECNICLDVAKDAVVSMCGHLFCWPCLHQWLDTRPNRPLCPVCKSSIGKEKVIPLYGRGGKETDPREKVPPRPRGQRTEDTSQSFPTGFHLGGGGENGHGGVQFSLGIGVFPISFFASFFNSAGIRGERRPDPPSPGSRQHTEEQFLSNVFMYIGAMFVIWLIFF